MRVIKVEIIAQNIKITPNAGNVFFLQFHQLQILRESQRKAYCFLNLRCKLT